MHTLQWISDNGSYILFGPRAPFILTSPVRHAIGGEPQIFKAPGQDGSTTYSTTLVQQNIIFEFTAESIGNSKMKSADLMDHLCNQLNAAFIPKTWGWLIYQNGRGGNVIRARAVTTPTPKEHGANYIKYECEMATDRPYWMDSRENVEFLGELQKLWRFPVRFPMKFGKSTQYTTINNPSVESVYPVFDIYSQLSTITITNETTGEYIFVNHAIAENQSMRIDTDEKTVTLYENGAVVDDVSNWADGDFIKLAPGPNRLLVQNNIPNDVPAAVIRYRDIVAGV